MIGALTSVVIEPLAGALEDVRVRLDRLCGAAGALQTSAFSVSHLGNVGHVQLSLFGNFRQFATMPSHIQRHTHPVQLFVW
jgi:hypothetical protein